MIDLVIKNGHVLDGSGNPGTAADIAVEGDRIVDIGNLDGLEAKEVLDVKGKVVSPGFIDMHSHSDISLLVAPYAESLAYQGITTVVTGQCGISPSPVSEKFKKDYLKTLGAEAFGDLFSGIKSFGDFLDFLEKQGTSINVEPLVGHGTIRAAVMGYSSEKANPEQLKQMQQLVEESLDEGAIGISSGLIYPPGYYSDTHELIECTKPVGKRNGFYFSHVRGEGASLLQSIQEEFEIGKATGASLQHSHYKASGKANWDKAEQGLEMIEKIRESGLEMSVDMYPYIASSNGLIDSLPDWTREGGVESTYRRLKDPLTREKIRLEIDGIEWDKVLISGCSNETYVGKYVSELAKEAGKDAYEWFFEAILETGPETDKIVFGMSEENVKMQLQYHAMMIGTDGYGIPPQGPFSAGAPHPRSFGTFPRVLGKYVRKEKVITLEQAINKMCGMPAEKLRLTDRGLLEKGYKADIVIFDPENVVDKAVFTDPKQYPRGIEYVLVNGKFVIRDKKHTKELSGKILSRI